MRKITPIFIHNFRVLGNRGFTLIEVLVSLAILAVGLLGLAMLQTTGLRYNTNSYSRTQATYLAYDLAERMRANVPAFQAGNYDVSAASANTIDSISNNNYSCNQNHNCVCDTGTCNNAAMAQFDLGQWYYNLDMLMPGAKDAATLNTLFHAFISRTNNQANITIYWLEQKRDATGNTTANTPLSQTWVLDIY